MSIEVGDKLPDGTFKVLTPSGPSDVSANDVFAGKKVVLFAVPGAFTPTCNNKHLPSYLKHADQIKASGVDTIACMAVNDVFVMDAWAQANAVGDRILMLADGNGTYARALGLEQDSTRFGMGVRARRFAMVVEDGVVKELNVDNPGEFNVSSAEFTCRL